MREKDKKSSAVKATPIPAAVIGLNAVAGVSQVVLAWTVSADTAVTGYKIRQTVDATETEIDVNGRTTATHTVTGLTVGKNYTFTIAAVAGSTESAESSATSAVTPVSTLLAAPTEAPLVGHLLRIGEVYLGWNAIARATSYKVYQDGVVIHTLTGDEYTVTGLEAGRQYSFEVSAVNSGGEGPKSSIHNEIKVTSDPPKVTGFSATAGVEQVALRWTASPNVGVTGYKIKQTVGGTETEIDVSGRTTTTHTVRGLTTGTLYSFTITAIAGSTDSEETSRITSRPKPPAVTGFNATAGVRQVGIWMDGVCGYGGNRIQDTANSGWYYNNN